MAELIENRWKRFGHDRVYVNTADGEAVGFVDLDRQQIHCELDGFHQQLHDCLERWLCQTTDPPKNNVSVQERPSSSPVPDSIEIPEATDLAKNRAGESAQAERDRINDQAPVRNLVARLMNVQTDERNWRVGADGERRVGRELDKLDTPWRCLHSVKVGNRGSDIDHLVIGPPGLITLNTKCHPNGKAWVGEHMVMINGQKTKYLRNSRHEAERAQRLLAQATEWLVPVHAAIVMVHLEGIAVKQMPTDVEVVTRRQVNTWLKSLPKVLTPGQIESVFAVARVSTTWTTQPKAAQRAA